MCLSVYQKVGNKQRCMHDSLVFYSHGFCENRTGNPTGAPDSLTERKIAIFDQYLAISLTRYKSYKKELTMQSE